MTKEEVPAAKLQCLFTECLVDATYSVIEKRLPSSNDWGIVKPLTLSNVPCVTYCIQIYHAAYTHSSAQLRTRPFRFPSSIGPEIIIGKFQCSKRRMRGQPTFLTRTRVASRRRHLVAATRRPVGGGWPGRGTACSHSGRSSMRIVAPHHGTSRQSLRCDISPSAPCTRTTSRDSAHREQGCALTARRSRSGVFVVAVADAVVVVVVDVAVAVMTALMAAADVTGPA